MMPQLYLLGIAFAAVAIVKRRSLIRPTPTSGRATWWIIGCLPFVVLWIWPWQSAFASHYFYVFASAFLFFCLGGKRWIRVILPSLIFLLICPGLPGGVNKFIIVRLQDYGSWMTFVYCKFALSWDYVKDGHMLILPWVQGIASSGGQTHIFIAEECSGFRSLMGMAVLALLYGADPKLMLSKKALLFICAIGMAVGFNTLRIFTSSTFVHYDLEKLSAAAPHSLLGHILMLVEILILHHLSGRLRLAAKKGVDENVTALKAA